MTRVLAVAGIAVAVGVAFDLTAWQTVVIVFASTSMEHSWLG